MAYNKHQSHGSSPLVACQGCWSEEPDQNSRTQSLHCLEYADVRAPSGAKNWFAYDFGQDWGQLCPGSAQDPPDEALWKACAPTMAQIEA